MYPRLTLNSPSFSLHLHVLKSQVLATMPGSLKDLLKTPLKKLNGLREF
jgi:hypothetical protein